MDRHKEVVLIDPPGYLLAAKTISKAKGFKPIATSARLYKGMMPQPQGHDGNVYGLACLELG